MNPLNDQIKEFVKGVNDTAESLRISLVQSGDGLSQVTKEFFQRLTPISKSYVIRRENKNAAIKG